MEQNLKFQLSMSAEQFGERKQFNMVLNSWQKSSLRVYCIKCAEKNNLKSLTKKMYIFFQREKQPHLTITSLALLK